MRVDGPCRIRIIHLKPYDIHPADSTVNLHGFIFTGWIHISYYRENRKQVKVDTGDIMNHAKIYVIRCLRS